MPRTTTHRALSVLALSGLALGVVPCAHAQNALGDGTALDNNLRVGSDGRNPAARDFRRELAYRNAIVTGNVAGGVAFRGDVGYSAAYDFRGATGSDDIFEFQRDAFFSGLATRGISGISAIQSTLAYSVTGQAQGLLGDLIINRPTVGSTVDTLDAPAGSRIDIYGTIGGTLRAPSAITLQEIDRPNFLNVVSDDQGNALGYVGSSDLLGVRALSPQNPVFGTTDPQGERDLLERLREDPTLSTPIERDDEENATDLRLPTYTELLESLGLHTRIEDTIDDRIEEPVTQPPGVRPPERLGGDTLAPLRDALREAERLNDPVMRARDAAAQRARNPLQEDFASPDAEGDDAEPVETLEERLLRTIEEAEEVLGRSVELDELRVASDDPAYTRHFDRGVELLEQGRYFDAEERFAAALQLAQGDPMAAIGRLHAQIGAGMYLSAGTNLRRLVIAYPEMLTLRLDDRFLPTGEQLDQTRMLLRERMAQGFVLNRDAAVLLSYLGVQTGNGQDVEDGLARYRELTTDPETGDADLLVPLLEKAWLSRDDQAGETSP